MFRPFDYDRLVAGPEGESSSIRVHWRPAEGLLHGAVTVAAILAVGLYVSALTWTIMHTRYETWGALLLGPILLLAPVPYFLRAARRDPDPRFLRLLRTALWVKLLGLVARYIVIYYVYGSGDSVGYDQEGARFAAAFRRGDFGADLGHGGEGTVFVQKLTGVIYTFVGPSRILGFIVFAWMGFVAVYLFYRAFRIAFPAGDGYRYAKLLFFLPSLVYWPSSIGKDAWMAFGLGLAAYGMARLLARRHGAFVFITAGAWALVSVRPHVAILLTIGLIVGYVLRRTRPGLGTLSKAVGLVVVVAIAIIVAGRFQATFKLEDLTSESAETVLEGTAERTSMGGSEFSARPVRTPLDLPLATVTVLFRPLPFEVRNAQMAVAALEGVILLVLFFRSGSRLRRVHREILSTPYVAAAVSYTLAFIVAFSSIGNFGILVRQRVQVLPFLLVLLAIPPARASRSSPLRRQSVTGRA